MNLSEVNKFMCKQVYVFMQLTVTLTVHNFTLYFEAKQIFPWKRITYIYIEPESISYNEQGDPF